MQVVQAASELSENFKKSGITADFSKCNEKSELKLNQDNETSIVGIAVHVTHEWKRPLWFLCSNSYYVRWPS